MYTEKVMDHFKNPRNQGTLTPASSVGQEGNPVCGDLMKIYIKIKKDKKGIEYIKDIKFETLGCASAIATSSMITDLAKGKTLAQAAKITKNDVADGLRGLPPAKLHCSNLADEGLRAAIKDYERKKKK